MANRPHVVVPVESKPEPKTFGHLMADAYEEMYAEYQRGVKVREIAKRHEVSTKRVRKVIIRGLEAELHGITTTDETTEDEENT